MPIADTGLAQILYPLLLPGGLADKEGPPGYGPLRPIPRGSSQARRTELEGHGVARLPSFLLGSTEGD